MKILFKNLYLIIVVFLSITVNAIYADTIIDNFDVGPVTINDNNGVADYDLYTGAGPIGGKRELRVKDALNLGDVTARVDIATDTLTFWGAAGSPERSVFYGGAIGSTGSGNVGNDLNLTVSLSDQLIISVLSNTNNASINIILQTQAGNVFYDNWVLTPGDNIITFSDFVGIGEPHVSDIEGFIFHSNSVSVAAEAGGLVISKINIRPAITQVERNALMALYNSTNGNTWLNSNLWSGSGSVDGTECNWFGVTCGGLGSKVVNIDLSSNNLMGALPTELGNLSALSSLDLVDNYLTGNIPASINTVNLPLLDHLFLDHNSLSGTLPASIEALANAVMGLSIFNNRCLSTTVQTIYDAILLKDPFWINCPNPKVFHFVDQTGISLFNSSITSASILIENLPIFGGSSSETKIRVSHGSLLINNVNVGAYGIVVNGDTVKINHTSAGNFGTSVNSVVTIGSLNDTFTSTTIFADSDPSSFSFSSKTGVELNTQYRSNIITISGLNTSAIVSISRGEYSKNNGSSWITVNSTVINGNTIMVRHTSSSSYQTQVDSVLTIGSISGTFSTTTRISIVNLPPSEIATLTPDDVKKIDPIEFKQGTDLAKGTFFTSLGPQVKPEDVQHLLPTGWTIDPVTGVISVPPGTPISLPALTLTPVAGVTLPENMPDLSKSFSLGGRGGQSFLDAANESLTLLGLSQFAFTQDPNTGQLVFTDPSVNAAFSLMPDATGLSQAAATIAPGVTTNSSGFIVVTLANHQQMIIRPIPQNPALLGTMLNGEVVLGSQGNVLISRNNSVLTGMFNLDVQQAAKTRMLMLRGASDNRTFVEYGDGSSQQVYPAPSNPELLKTLLLSQIEGLTDVEFNTNGTITGLYNGRRVIIETLSFESDIKAVASGTDNAAGSFVLDKINNDGSLSVIYRSPLPSTQAQKSKRARFDSSQDVEQRVNVRIDETETNTNCLDDANKPSNFIKLIDSLARCKFVVF